MSGSKGTSGRTNSAPKRDDDYAAGLARLDALARVDWIPPIPPAALLLTQRQVAVLLNVSERTVRYLISRRKLPVRFIGARALVPRAAVEQFAKKTAPQ